ncbi:unnamed protein product [Lactuca saligna]|uniref:Uncharacterized protein n=1 Tax=Lactuca saligna TaxID=75948 RepID=A0AA35V9R1_LACSI|nr:unnamed protein product [Lactuca saligna]
MVLPVKVNHRNQPKKCPPSMSIVMVSMVHLGLDDCLQQLFFNIRWQDYLDLSTRTYTQPTLEFLSTYAWDDTEGCSYLDSMVGSTDSHTPPSTLSWEHAMTTIPTSIVINGLNSRAGPKIAHRILLTSIFGRHEPREINTFELYFLYCMTSNHWSCLGFTTFFLDKCDIIRTKTTGDICIGDLITLIGLDIGHPFPESEYVPMDDPPLHLLDCFALTRMELVVPINNR